MVRHRNENFQSRCIVTSSQMREIDRATIEDMGLSGMVLMENAGLGCVEEIEEFLKGYNENARKVCILCGTGNNGGDGFVIARHLLNRGWEVTLYLLGACLNLKHDAQKNASLFENFSGEIIEIAEQNIHQFMPDNFDLIVDAIYGNGFNGEIKGIQAKVVERVNNSSTPVFAVDIPSGINADRCLVGGVAIKADITAAIGFPKISHYLYPSKHFVGDLVVIDIGLASSLVRTNEFQFFTVTRDLVKSSLPERRKDVHKGECGSVALIAGSRGMTGAAVLSGHSSFLTGSGYVKLICPIGVNDIFEKKLIETITYPVEQTSEVTLAYSAKERILNIVQDCDVVTIGPGLSSHPETQKLILDLVLSISRPMVLDADALNALSNNMGILKQCKSQIVLTPHVGEMVRLTGKTKREVLDDPVSIARDFAREYGVFLVLKSAVTLIAAPDGRVAFNTTGNEGMATAGSGDVLSGVISSLIAQKLPPFEASMSGVWLHGMAGDLSREVKGPRSLIASDIMDALPRAIRKII